MVRGTGEVAEATFEIGLADLDLFAKAVATGKVAIWLNPPAARNLPASGGHMLHDPPEQVWIETLNDRSEEHTSELQSLMRISYAVFCLKKKTNNNTQQQLQKYTN